MDESVREYVLRSHKIANSLIYSWKSTHYHLHYILNALVTWSVTYQLIHKDDDCYRKSWVRLESEKDQESDNKIQCYDKGWIKKRIPLRKYISKSFHISASHSSILDICLFSHHQLLMHLCQTWYTFAIQRCSSISSKHWVYYPNFIISYTTIILDVV